MAQLLWAGFFKAKETILRQRDKQLTWRNIRAKELRRQSIQRQMFINLRVQAENPETKSWSDRVFRDRYSLTSRVQAENHETKSWKDRVFRDRYSSTSRVQAEISETKSLRDREFSRKIQRHWHGRKRVMSYGRQS